MEWHDDLIDGDHEADDEGPGDHDAHLMDDDATVRCPACGRSVYAESPKCPHCGEWFEREAWESGVADRRPSKTWVWWVALILVIVFTIVALTRLDYW